MATEDYDYNGDVLENNPSVISCYGWDPFEFRNVHNNWIFYSASIGCPIAIFGGIFTNILAFVVLVRSRLWLKHEGYVYLAANFCTNVGILLFCTSSFWLTSVYGGGLYYPPNTSNFMCKLWHFLMSIFFASGWLSVALLFDVYLREQLIHRRRCGCPMFAAKYCTLFASKIIVGVIFSVLFVLGVPYLASFELYFDGECYPSEFMVFVVALVVEMSLMCVLPFVFFLPIIVVATHCTKKEGSTFGFSQIEDRSICDEQMRVMSVTLSLMTLFPQFFIFFHRAFASHMGVSVVIELAYGLSIGLQPILCFIILKALREEFRSQMRSIRCCRRLFPSLDRDEEVAQLSDIQEDTLNTVES